MYLYIYLQPPYVPVTLRGEVPLRLHIPSTLCRGCPRTRGDGSWILVDTADPGRPEREKERRARLVQPLRLALQFYHSGGFLSILIFPRSPSEDIRR